MQKDGPPEQRGIGFTVPGIFNRLKSSELFHAPVQDQSLQIVQQGSQKATFAMASDPTRLPARFVFIAAHAKDPTLLQHVQAWQWPSQGVAFH
jgi:hypothetical protein